MRKYLLLVGLVSLCGCTTIHFDNGGKSLSQNVQEQWHHNYAFALYEGSAPADLKKNCRNSEWQSVKTEISFVNGLASFVVNMFGPIWYPKTVTTTCKEI